MAYQNCWEVKNCGRETGGNKVADMGACPAATDKHFHGINNGMNAGRICWVSTGTYCDGDVQGSYAQKTISCLSCEFYLQVKKEEGTAFVLKPQPVKT